MNQPQNKEKVSPKMKQFVEEVQELCDRYQYTLQPQMQYQPHGITPTIRVVDKVPERKDVELVKKDIERREKEVKAKAKTKTKAKRKPAKKRKK